MRQWQISRRRTNRRDQYLTMQNHIVAVNFIDKQFSWRRLSRYSILQATKIPTQSQFDVS